MKKRGLICIAIVMLASANLLYAPPAAVAPPAVARDPGGPPRVVPPSLTGPPPLPTNYPRRGLVSFWQGEGNTEDSVGKNHGHRDPVYAVGKVGKCFKFDGKGAYIDFGNLKPLQITGSQTITMWIRPDALGPRRSILHKAWGGECSIVLEPTGEISYMYGSSGRSGEPYYSITTLAVAKAHGVSGIIAVTGRKAKVRLNQWTHLAIVRDLEAKKLRWYFNGRLLVESTATILQARASGASLFLGKGYLSAYSGLIDEVGIWNRPLTAAEIRAVAGAFAGSSDLGRGLVGYWPGDGNANDAAGQNHGKATRVPNRPRPAAGRLPAPAIKYTTDRHGQAGKAFRFGNTNDFVTVPDSKALDTDDAFTLSAWIQPSKSHHGHLIVKYGQVGIKSDYTVEFGGNGRIHLGVGSGTDSQGFDSKAAPPIGKWTHVAITFDRGKIQFFLNGKLDASFTSRIKHTNREEYDNDDVTIGGWSSGGDPFDGAMDDIAIWNRALGAEEVHRLFEAPSLGMAMASGGSAPHATRIGDADRLTATSGDLLKGTILNEKYVLTNAFGELEIPAARVAGVVPDRSNPGRVWLLLVDGQAVCGKLATEAIKFRLSIGSEVAVPLATMIECGYQVTADKPAGKQPALPIVELTDGQRLAWTNNTLDLTLKTDHGEAPLSMKSLLSIGPATGPAGGHQVRFVNGSTLSGTLTAEKIALKLELGPEASIWRGQVRYLVWPPTAGKAAAEATAGKPPATVALRNGDTLRGEVADKQFTIRTEFGEAKLRPDNALKMTFDAAKGNQVRVRTWDGGILAGELVEPTVTVAIGSGGPTLKIKAVAIASITRSSALPPAAVVKRIEKLIARLGSANFKDREDATAELIRIGKPARGLLKKHRKDPDPEVRQRIQKILESIGGAGPANTGPRPAVDIGGGLQDIIIRRR